MTPELFEQIEKIFYHARQVKPEERAVFLAAVCAGNDELRQEVEQLLDSSDGTDRPLSTPVADLIVSVLANMPKAADELAGTLNNRALSRFDLGKEDEAIELWNKALRAEPEHLEATYNRGLVLWRGARLTDDVLVREIKELAKSRPDDAQVKYLLGLIHLERDAAREALDALESIQGPEADRDDVMKALAFAGKRWPHSTRLLRTFEACLDSFNLSVDGKYLLQGGWNKPIQLWDIATARCVRTFGEASLNEGSVVLSADCRYALSQSSDGPTKLWEVATGECVRTFEAYSIKSGACLSSDGKYVLSAGWYQPSALTLWELATGAQLRTFAGHAEAVTSVCLSADGRTALSGSYDHTLKLWDTATGECLRTFEGHTNGVTSVSLSADGKDALSGSNDRTLKLWELATGGCKRTFLGHALSVTSVCRRADGKYALSGSYDKTVRLWEVATGRCVRTFEASDFVQSVNMSADGKYAVSDDHGVFKLWNLEQSDYRAQFAVSVIIESEAAANTTLVAREGLALSRKALADGDAILAANQTRHVRSLPGYKRFREAVALWTQLYLCLPRKTLNGAWETRTFKGHTEWVSSISLSLDGRYVLSGSFDKTVKLWEIATGECVKTFEGHTDYVVAVDLSADAKYALSIAGRPYQSASENTLRIWEVSTGKCIQTIEGPQEAFTSVRLSTDNKFAVSGSSEFYQMPKRENAYYVERHPQHNAVRLWDLVTGKCVRTLDGHGENFSEGSDFKGHADRIAAVSLSADGKYALSGSRDCRIKLWNLIVGQCVRTLTGHMDGVNAVSLSADSKYALSGSNDRTVKLWAVTNGDCVGTFAGHTEPVTAVSLSADGRYALSGSKDKTLRLWETATGKCLRTFEGHTDEVTSVSLSVDGKYAVSGSYDGLIKVWLLDWELEERQPADWDVGAREYLRIFLTQQTSYAASLPADRSPTDEEISLALTRRGKPVWSEEDFQSLLYTLGCAGYGWLRPEGVRRELEEMAAEWDESALAEEIL
jgi:WD40 repeat protein